MNPYAPPRSGAARSSTVAGRRALIAIGVGEIVAAIAWLASDAASLAATPRNADAVFLRLDRETWTGTAGVLNRSWLDVSIVLALAIMVGGAGILARRSWGRTLSLASWIAAMVGTAIDQLVFFSLVYPAVASVEQEATTARAGDRFHAEVVTVLVTDVVITLAVLALTVGAIVVLTRPRVRGALAASARAS